MAIWKSPIDINEMMEMRTSTLTACLGIEFIEAGDNYLKGKMPIDYRTLQPLGIMHGGASCVLAETLGSVAGCHCVDRNTQVCVGLTLNINHIRMVEEGCVYGIAKPIHLGKKTQVWQIDITDQDDKLVSITHLTLIILDRK